MEINLQTKVAALLDAYPDLEKTLLELSPAFARLRNPVLRRTAAKVATLQQAARIAGIAPGLLVQTLRKAAGLASGDISDTDFGTDDNSDGIRPAWFDETNITVRFDAGAIINSGHNPMQDILKLSDELAKNEIMELTAPFKPVPVMDLLQSKGFRVWYSQGKAYFLKQ